MLLLHQLHQVDDDRVDAFETVCRRSILPAQENQPIQLCWYARSLPDSFGGSEIATITQIKQPEALSLFSDSRSRVGAAFSELASLRRGVQNRLSRFLTFSPVREQIESGELGPSGPTLYLHDFVTPRRGRFDEYDRELNTWYRELAKLPGGTASSVWAGLQVIPGGGTARECVIISRVADEKRFMVPIVRGLPENLPGPLGEWMRVAKSLRDTWTSRLVVAPEWSPLH